MTPLRRRMIEDMQIRNLAPRTQVCYVEQVDRFARHFRKSPELLGPAEIRAWQIYLARDKRLAASSISVAVAAFGSFMPSPFDGHGPSRMRSHPAGSRTSFPKC